MATFYRTQAGDLNDAYWTDSSNTTTGTLTTLNFQSGDELDLNGYNNGADYNLTMGATLYDVGIIKNTYGSNTAKLTITAGVSTTAGIQIKCTTEIDGGTLIIPLIIDLNTIYASGVGNVTVLDGSYAIVSAEVIYIEAQNVFGIINNGYCATIDVGSVNDAGSSQAAIAVSNNEYIGTLTFNMSPLDIVYGSGLLVNTGNIDKVLIKTFTATSDKNIGVLVTNSGNILDLEYEQIEVQGCAFAGGLLNNSGTITLLTTILVDWAESQTNVVYNSSTGTIVTWTGSLASQVKGNYDVVLNDGIINTLDCSIVGLYNTSRTYAIFKNNGAASVIVDFTENISCYAATTSSPSAPIFVNTGTIFNWVGNISGNSGYITDYGMSNSGVIREWYGYCQGINTLLNNAGGVIWYWQSSIIPNGVTNGGDIYTFFRDADVNALSLSVVKKGQLVIINQQSSNFSTALLADLTGTATSSTFLPFTSTSGKVGPWVIGEKNVGPFPII